MKSAGNTTVHAWLRQFSSSLGSVATSHGFKPESQDEAADGRRYWDWRRSCGWRVDQISAVFMVSRPTSFVVNLAVLLPIEPLGFVDVDGWGLAWLAGSRGMSSYRLPVVDQQAKDQGTLPASFVSLRNEITADLEKHIGWFEELYGSPSATLDRAMKPGRNGCRAGFPPVVEYLKGVIARQGSN